MALRKFLYIVAVIGMLGGLTACSGDGASTSNKNFSPGVLSGPPKLDTPLRSSRPSREEIAAASQFASRATFGIQYNGLESIARQGIEDWLDHQLSLDYSSHGDEVQILLDRREAGDFEEFENNNNLLVQFWRAAWWKTVMTAPDQVQQRVAFAFSEIFVITSADVFDNWPHAVANYNDMLLKNTTGNFRDLLFDVATHPSMGVVLSHLNNRKYDAERNTYPDENFAREVMQLFSIGLFELNLDGTPMLDDDGNLIPAYDNDDIHELAKVFTGLSYGGPEAYFGKRYPPHFQSRMRMFQDQHEPGEKHLLNGFVIPAGQDGIDDVNDAIDNLFNHPNVGPFIGKQLIQRLVTSNPSPAYVERVARAFNGDTHPFGLRGDMKTVIKAVLLDPEATEPENPAHFGKVREPIVRMASLARQFSAKSPDGQYFNNGYRMQYFITQHPFNSPSVFNFFQPSYAPSGPISNAGLVAPEFQITNPNTIIGVTNQIELAIFHEDQLFDHREPFMPTNLDLWQYEHLAEDVSEFVERLDLMLTHGKMDAETRNTLERALNPIRDMRERVLLGIYLTLISPSYAVES